MLRFLAVCSLKAWICVFSGLEWLQSRVGVSLGAKSDILRNVGEIAGRRGGRGAKYHTALTSALRIELNLVCSFILPDRGRGGGEKKERRCGTESLPSRKTRLKNIHREMPCMTEIDSLSIWQ